MSYNFKVGNAIIQYCKDDNYICIDVEYMEHPDAPDHCPYTGKGNLKSPGYSQWLGFCEDAGITELFYGKGWDRDSRANKPCSDTFHRELCLIESHPGAAVITEKDYLYVKAARIKREMMNAGKPAGYFEDDNIDNGTDSTLARLLWLEFWFKYAIDNCEYPVITNS